MMQLQEGARIPSGPKFSNYRARRKQNCSAHSWSSSWTKASSATGTAEGELHTEGSAGLWDPRAAAQSSHSPTAPRDTLPMSPAPVQPCVPSTSPSIQHKPIHGFNSFHSPDFITSTPKMPWRGGLRAGEALVNPLCFWKKSGKMWSKRAGQGNGEPRLLHALNIIVTTISDPHRNEFADD